MTDTVPLKPCCGGLTGDVCECLTPAQAAAELAALGRERPPIVLRTGPAADAARARRTEHPLLVAMRAAATNVYDQEGNAR